MKIPSLLVFLLAICMVSCNNDFPDEFCPCHEIGNGIGGWDDGRDSTVVNKKDSVGGFEITVDEWGNSETLNIKI